MTQRHALLPVHPRTGLTAIGYTSRGPIWPALGGSEDTTEDTDVEAEDGDSADPDPEDAEDDDKPLGPKGEKAYEAEKVKRRQEAARRRAAEKERDDLRAQLAAAQKPTDGDDDRPDPDEIRRQIQAEFAAEAARERVLDKIEAKAARGFADPADAAALLLKDHSIDDFLDDGKPDVEAIQDALTALLESKPYLGAAQGGNKRFKGTGDGGAKPPKPARPTSLSEAVANKFSRS